MYYVIGILFGLIPEVFNYEDVCELVALSNNSINRIVNEYIEFKNKI